MKQVDLSIPPSGGRVDQGQHRELIETVLTEGCIESPLVKQFGSKSVASQAQFVSLLYYMGMITISRDVQPGAAMLKLEIPNRVIREL